MKQSNRAIWPCIASILVGSLLAGCPAKPRDGVAVAPVPSPPREEQKPWEEPGTEVGQEITGPDGGPLVWVAAGSFRMGSTDEVVDQTLEQMDSKLTPEQKKCFHAPRWMLADELPARTVEMDGFWLGKYEVTNRQYWEFCQQTGRAFPSESDQGDDHPVTQVDWEDARAYCEHYGLSLPTEAQWEYAARGPGNRMYPWGDDWDPQKLCWGENKGPNGASSPVGSFPDGASWCGALDMSGNAYEWCADWYQYDYYAGGPSSNPPGPGSGVKRVLRGGSWPARAEESFRCPDRNFNDVDYRSAGVGFRCASTVK